MRRVVTGEELAQLYNPDPFAMPRWRSPVYRTPFGIILLVKFARLLGWIARTVARHPLAASVLALSVVIRSCPGLLLASPLARSASLVSLLTGDLYRDEPPALGWTGKAERPPRGVASWRSLASGTGREDLSRYVNRWLGAERTTQCR
jgi:hypothetical protein